MKISMYEASIPVFVHTLGNLNSILQKGVQYAEARKFDPNNLAATRLFPDMLPLTRQVQIASDTAKFVASRLSGTEAPKFEDNETTIAELIARVDKTLDYLKGFRPDQFEGAEEQEDGDGVGGEELQHPAPGQGLHHLGLRQDKIPPGNGRESEQDVVGKKIVRKPLQELQRLRRECEDGRR